MQYFLWKSNLVPALSAFFRPPPLPSSNIQNEKKIQANHITQKKEQEPKFPFWFLFKISYSCTVSVCIQTELFQNSRIIRYFSVLAGTVLALPVNSKTMEKIITNGNQSWWVMTCSLPFFQKVPVWWICSSSDFQIISRSGHKQKSISCKKPTRNLESKELNCVRS